MSPITRLLSSPLTAFAGCLLALLLVAAPEAHAYKYLAECKPQWAPWRLPAKYELNFKASDNVNYQVLHQTLVAAFATWSSVPGQYMIWQDGGTSEQMVDDWGKKDGTNLLVFREDEWPKDMDGAIAVTTPQWYGTTPCYIVDADILFNGVDFTWGTNGSASVMDVQAIATHEIGHALGLADLYEDADAEKTMYGVGGEGETKARDLDQDDIDGLVALYPGALPANLVGAACDASCVETDGFTFFCGKEKGVLTCTRKCSVDDDCPVGYLCTLLDEGGRSCWIKPDVPIGGSCRNVRDCLDGLVCRAPKGSTDTICTTLCPGTCSDGFACGLTSNDDQACLRVVAPGEGEDCSAAACATGLICVTHDSQTVCTTSCTFSNECKSGDECINMGSQKGCWLYDETPSSAFTVLNALPAAPTPPGTAITIVAEAEAPHTPLFQFSVGLKGQEAIVLSAWSTNKFVAWTPAKAGLYEIVALTRDSESKSVQDDRQTLDYSVEEAPVVDGDADEDAPISAAKGGGGCQSANGPAALLMLMLALGLSRRRLTGRA